MHPSCTKDSSSIGHLWFDYWSKEILNLVWSNPWKNWKCSQGNINIFGSSWICIRSIRLLFPKVVFMIFRNFIWQTFRAELSRGFSVGIRSTIHKLCQEWAHLGKLVLLPIITEMSVLPFFGQETFLPMDHRKCYLRQANQN